MAMGDNTSKINSLIEAINNLPSANAGGGGSGSDVRLQSRYIDPTESEQPVIPDSGYDGFSHVTVRAISKTYVGSNVTRKSAQTYTPGTSNQTIASGQYLTGAQTIAGDADLIPGNIKSGVSIFGVTGSYTGSGSGTTPKLQSKNVAPTESAQPVTPDAGYDGLSQVTVGAISKTYVGSNVTRKAAQTYTPGTTNQNIASGQYLSGTQTIKGDSNLVASNIKSGVSIFGVTGTASAGTTVQRKTGSFTYTGGIKEINCGFVPDLVLIKGPYLDNYSGHKAIFNAAFAFAEDSRTGAYENHIAWMYTPEVSSASLREVWCWKTSNGFGIDAVLYDGNWNETSVSQETFEYVAVKYT